MQETFNSKPLSVDISSLIFQYWWMIQGMSQLVFVYPLMVTTKQSTTPGSSYLHAYLGHPGVAECNVIGAQI